jgi:hypothetical protein
MMPTLPVLRRRITQACGVLFLVLALVDLLPMLLGHGWSVFLFIKTLIEAALGVGLLLGNLFARRAAALLLLMVTIGLPIGYINPFNASDMMAGGGTAPSLASILLWMVPLELLLLFIVWAVDPLARERAAADIKP